ncbi:alpha/beta hydrolase [Naumannella sp. ID2617S]|nr:alpha/beta hydrolase [Naumannella sp. ID2617S]
MVLVLVLGVLLGWWLRPGTAVGHFRSVAGHDRYQTAYAEALRDLPPPAATLDLRTELGIVRTYRFAGANPQLPPIVLLADRGRATPDWAPLVGALVRQRTVYAVDTLGEAGLSLQARTLSNDSDAANWLFQVLGQLPAKQFVLAGAGTGGWAAVNLAVRRPGVVAGLVLIDPERVLADPPSTAGVREFVATNRYSPQGWRSAWLDQRAGAPVTGAIGRLALSGLVEHTDGSRIGDTLAERPLRELQIPTLVLLGGASTVHDARAAETRARLLPRGTVRFWPDAPHDLVHARTPQVLTELTAFLR